MLHNSVWLHTGWLGFYLWQRQRIFPSSLCVHINSEVHPASYPVGTKGLSLGIKCGQDIDANNSPPSSAEVKNE
jgi:hypothetical protein